MSRKRQLAGVQRPGERAEEAPIWSSATTRSARAIESGQLKLQRERGTDLTLFSPSAGRMAHHLGNETTSLRVGGGLQRSHPPRLHAVPGQLRRRLPAAAVARRAAGELHPRAASAASRSSASSAATSTRIRRAATGQDPPLTDRSWYPLYEKMVELDVPAMVHVSSSCNPGFHGTGAHYINGDTTAFMQFLLSDLFKDFPTLRFVIPHGGGAVPYHWGRYRGLAQDLKQPAAPELLLDNVFFDTCVYHEPGIELLTKVIPIDNILFGSEMIGAVRGRRPGHRPLLRRHQALRRRLAHLTDEDRAQDLRRECPPRLPPLLNKAPALTSSREERKTMAETPRSMDSSAPWSTASRPSATFRSAPTWNPRCAFGTAPYDGVVFEMEHSPWDPQLRDRLQYMLNRKQILEPARVAPGGHADGAHSGEWRRDEPVARETGARHRRLRRRWPHVSTVEQAYNAVAACRYPRRQPRRSTSRPACAATGRRAPRATGVSQQEYYARPTSGRWRPRARSWRHPVIEDSRASRTCRDAEKVPGIGAVLIGEGDLSQELGHPREYDHPEVVEAIVRIATAAHATCRSGIRMSD